MWTSGIRTLDSSVENIAADDSSAARLNMENNQKQLFSDNLFGSTLEDEQLLEDDGLVDLSQQVPEVLSADPTLVRTERLRTEKQADGLSF